MPTWNTLGGLWPVPIRPITKAAGFQVAYDNVLGGLFNIVRASDPAGGSMVRKGATVTLTIV